MSWERLPIIEGGVSSGCLCCGGRGTKADPKMLIAIGFGMASVTCDGRCVYDEPRDPKSDKDFWTVRKAEYAARKDPDHDWRVVIYGPLWGAEWQRHAPNHWMLVKKNQGFA